MLLFIDEADAFLASRKGGSMSEQLRNALTTILYHTGTPTSQFMLVIATNRPGDLDSAVLDRLDESIEFGLPELDARRGMVQLYFDMYISKPLRIDWRQTPAGKAQEARAAYAKGGAKPAATNGAQNGNAKAAANPLDLPDNEVVDESALHEVAKRLHGFSGREISKLFTSLQTHVLYGMQRNEKGYKRLPKSMLYEVVDSKVLEHGRTAEFQVTGYNYEVTASNPPSMPGSVPPTPGQRRPSCSLGHPPPDILLAATAA